MPPTNQNWQKLKFAATNPEAVMRRLRGQSLIEIELEEIRSFLPDARVILEAGAMDGTDTVAIAAAWPDAVVHAFEPVPGAMANVRRNAGHLPNVRLHSDALSNEVGTSEMFVSTTADGEFRPDSSSLLAPAEHVDLMPEVGFSKETIQVPTITLDLWAEREQIDRVDLLWLDLQGMELAVLKASPRVVAGALAVCMEVSRRELYKGLSLYPEVISWMSAQGFSPAIERMGPYFGNVLFVR